MCINERNRVRDGLFSYAAIAPALAPFYGSLTTLKGVHIHIMFISLSYLPSEIGLVHSIFTAPAPSCQSHHHHSTTNQEKAGTSTNVYWVIA